MPFTFAGHWGPEPFLDAAGNALPGASVEVLLKGTSTRATLYTDRTKATTMANPVTVDGNGNGEFWAEPGDYTIKVSVAGVLKYTDDVTVPVDPADVGDGSVSTARLADGAVTTLKLVDGAVTAAKVAADVATQAELDAIYGQAHTWTADQIFNTAARFLDKVNAKSVITKEGPVYNVKHPDFAGGAVLDGVADDTAAYQAAINEVMTRNAGTVFQPLGTARITATLEYVGTSANTITITGACKAGAGPRGSIIKWDGPVGGTTMRLRGGRNLLVKNLAFTLGTNAPLIDLDLISNQGAGGSGLANCTIKDCHFGGAAGVDSSFIRLGENTFQADTIEVSDCTFAGNNTRPTYGIRTATANAKNFHVSKCEIAGCQYGIFHGAGGTNFLLIEAVTFLRNQIADVRAGTGEISIIGCGSEASEKLVTGTTGTNHGSVSILNSYFDTATVSTSDYVIDYTGSLFISGCRFANRRIESTTIPKVRGGGLSGADPSNIVSIGNQYENATRFAPIYDGSDNWWKDRLSHSAPLHVVSFGDIGGVGGALTQLQSVWGDALYTSLVRMAQNSGFTVQHDTDGAGTLVDVFRLLRDAGYSPNQTAAALRYKDIGGTAKTEQISLGAVDSGGAGFRTLRVPN